MTTNTTTVLVSPPSTLAVEDPCAPVIEALRGQRLNIPDLFAIYPDWKGKLHPNYEQVREEFEQWLVTLDDPSLFASRVFCYQLFRLPSHLPT